MAVITWFANWDLSMNRIQKMKHIAIIVLCDKFILILHTNLDLTV